MISKVIKKSSLIFIVFCAPVLIASCSTNKTTSTKVNDSFIKGVDVSSYANVASNFLWEKNIRKDKKTYYEYKDFENTKAPNSDLNLQEYIDNNLYSFINENGERVYENFFKILKEEGGVNSIRLRIWNNPNDEKGNSYMGVGANDLDTDIYIMKQAIKYGINHFNISFHYSDFWADPGAQIVPKAWTDYNTKQMKEAIKQFAYDSLLKIYQETKILPSQVQIGNEIGKGFIWDTSNTKKYDSGYRDTKATSMYLQSAIEGVNEVENYINSNYSENFNVKIALHLESIDSGDATNSITAYMENQFLYKNVDIIGISYYPFWQKNLKGVSNAVLNFWQKFNKEIIFEEYSNPYTSSNTGYTGDIDLKDYSNKVPTTASGQTVMLNAFLNQISELNPDKETGFYYWEPGWLYTGKQTWSNQEGIDYKMQNNTSLNWSYGYNWTNQGLFDRNGIMLPALKILKNFERNPKNNYSHLSISSWAINDLVNPVKDEWSTYNDDLLKNTKLIWNPSLYKNDISKELYIDYNGLFSNEINYYIEDTNTKPSKDQIISFLKDSYKRIMWQDISINNIKYNDSDNSYSLTLNTNSSFYYKGSANITIKLKQYESNSIDLTSQELSISKNESDWASKIFEFIHNQSTNKTNNFNLESSIKKYLNLKGGSNTDYKKGIWLYDDTNGFDRYSDWHILKTDKIFINETSTEYDKLNKEKYDWPSTNLGDIFTDNSNNNQTFYFGITIKLAASNNKEKEETGNSVTYLDVGKEPWKYPNILLFKINLKWNSNK